jgi:hypothetical protein
MQALAMTVISSTACPHPANFGSLPSSSSPKFAKNQAALPDFPFRGLQ